ncbi:Mannan polymerase II complex anp1 subunit [Coemansia guatemalensis]|uniref:Mannan polymerase II complex anp1 subunit n=1 Tax=Coemansia guatemalensis TaxID=2761395 RepID=A0A9W8HWL3_9FUNG|nr:Mannan polymerase II complex anp1 subunit [Coemansia guatemalensis]
MLCVLLLTLFRWAYLYRRFTIEAAEGTLRQTNFYEKIKPNPPPIKVLGKSTTDVDSVSAEKLDKIRKILAKNTELREITSEPDPDSVLILTPIKDSAEYLDRYFSLIDRLDYPRSSISIAFLVSDSIDKMQQILVQKQKQYQQDGPEEQRFNQFEIYRQDFFYILSHRQRHDFKMQRERQTMRALKDEQWVIWIDGDLEEYPPTIIKDLMAYDKDIIVPACMENRTKAGGPIRHTLYDHNAWQETDVSRKMLAGLKDTDFLAEDTKYIRSGRRYMDEFKNEEIVPLDGIGGTFALVKSHVHRSGVVFPTWLVEHEVETEGFAKLAKLNGFGVYGLPSYHVIHVRS